MESGFSLTPFPLEVHCKYRGVFLFCNGKVTKSFRCQNSRGPCQYDTTYRRKDLGGQKSRGMYCSLHNKKYGQIGISLSPKMGRGVAAPEGSRA